MLIDTHVHFDGLKEIDLGAVLKRASVAGVGAMVAVGGSPAGNVAALEMAQNHTSIFAAVGYDRYCAVQNPPQDDLEVLLTTGKKVVAVGEIGLDFHHQAETRPLQESLFVRMLETARRHTLPVIVHCRESESALLPLLKEHAAAWKGQLDRIGVIHCFTGTEKFAREVLGLGFLISFSGILTFRNAESLRNIVQWIPEDRLLIETDSPYLAPIPHRGETNEPSFVRLVAETLATCRRCPVERAAYITSVNADRLFGLSEKGDGGPLIL